VDSQQKLATEILSTNKDIEYYQRMLQIVAPPLLMQNKADQ